MANKDLRARVCVLSPFPPPYGGIAHWSLLVKAHSDNLGSVSVEFFDTSIKGRSRFHRDWMFMLPMARQLFAIWLIFLSGRIDVFHGCTSGGKALVRDVFVAILARAFQKKYIMHLHFGRAADIFGRWSVEKLILVVAIYFSHALVALERKTYDLLVARYPGKAIAQLPNAIDTAGFSVGGAKKNQVVFGGWVIRTKGVEELLSVWSKLSREHLDWLLVIAGPYDGTYLNFLKERYDFFNVDVLGEVSNAKLIQCLSESKIMCLPSHTEGFPFIVLEAMAAGCAIVASDVGAISEMIGGGGGAVVPPQNEERLRYALECLINDSELISEYAACALDRVRTNYNFPDLFNQYRSLWKRVYEE